MLNRETARVKMAVAIHTRLVSYQGIAIFLNIGLLSKCMIVILNHVVLNGVPGERAFTPAFGDVRHVMHFS